MGTETNQAAFTPRKIANLLARPEGFEPPTPRFVVSFGPHSQVIIDNHTPSTAGNGRHDHLSHFDSTASFWAQHLGTEISGPSPLLRHTLTNKVKWRASPPRSGIAGVPLSRCKPKSRFRGGARSGENAKSDYG